MHLPAGFCDILQLNINQCPPEHVDLFQRPGLRLEHQTAVSRSFSKVTRHPCSIRQITLYLQRRLPRPHLKRTERLVSTKYCPYYCTRGNYKPMPDGARRSLFATKKKKSPPLLFLSGPCLVSRVLGGGAAQTLQINRGQRPGPFFHAHSGHRGSIQVTRRARARVLCVHRNAGG